MAYTAFDKALPAGTQTGVQFVGSTNANDCALRDAIISGAMQGFIYKHTSGPNYTDPAPSNAEIPPYQFWRDGAAGTTILRAGNTYDANGYCTQSSWSLSTDSGVTWNAMFVEGRSFDASGNLTSTTGGSGIIAWFHQWVGKFKALRTSYTAHAAATTSVHGIPASDPLASQSASGVAISGGSINGTSIGTGTPAEGFFRRACEQFVDNHDGGDVSIDWSYGGSFLWGATAFTLTFQNIPSNRIATHALYATNLNNVTFAPSTNVSWGATGKPNTSNAVLVQLVTFNGGLNVMAIVAWKI